MKKTSLALLIAVMIAGLFLGCSQDLTVDADVYYKTDTFCVNGKYFSTLQGAVDYIKGINRMKAAGDNDNVIYLTKDAVGPGAVIADIQGLTIDFAGHTYSFSNVTAVQGNKEGDFGLSITDGSTVTLKGLRLIDLYDSAPRLTMVYISGDSTSLTIEEAPRMVVEPGQFVFWAADGASLTIGGETQIGGGVAATGTEENTPVVTFNDAAEIAVSELTADQAVVIINTSADSAISSFAASNGTVLIVSGEGSVTVDSNDSGDEASYEIHNTSAEATITVKTEGGSDQVIEAGQGVVVEEGTPTVGVATYAAAIGAKFFETLEEAVENAESGDTILLLKDIDLTETIIISESLTINLNEKVISASTRAFLVKDGTFTLDGKGTVSCEAYTDDEHSGSVIRLGDNTVTGTPKLIVNKDVTVFTDAEYGITYFGNKTTETVEIFGKVTGYSAALSGNGSPGYEDTLVIIREGAVVTSTESAAVYQPQAGELVIEGGSFSGKAAVYAKAGSVIITGGTFEVMGMDSYREYRYNGNGCEPTGDAIILDSCNYPGGEPSLTIAGNPAVYPVDGAHCFAVYHAALTTTDTPEEGIVVPGASVDMTEYEGSGDLYLEYGYWNKSNGTWHKLEAATVGEQAELKGYSTLQGALDAAENGETVVLLCNLTYEDCTEHPLKFKSSAASGDRNVTLDLNGKAITAALNNVSSIGVLEVSGAGGTVATLAVCDSVGGGGLYGRPQTGSDGWTVTVAVVHVFTNGHFILDSGTIEMLHGLAATNEENAYGIDILTNGGPDAVCTINGGRVISTAHSAMGIRAFCNSVNGSATLIVNDGYIEGYGRGIWLQNPSSNKNGCGLFEVNGGTIKAKRAVDIGDFNTEGEAPEEDEKTLFIELADCTLISTDTSGCIWYDEARTVSTSTASCYRQNFDNYKITIGENITREFPSE